FHPRKRVQSYTFFPNWQNNISKFFDIILFFSLKTASNQQKSSKRMPSTPLRAVILLQTWQKTSLAQVIIKLPQAKPIIYNV
ncbi:MAG: hypothetical protein ACI308_10050, partial [Muribaculaceae bacterium]